MRNLNRECTILSIGFVSWALACSPPEERELIDHTEESVCGNNVVNEGEACDSGHENGKNLCKKVCNEACTKWLEPTVECGNGMVECDEQCDNGDANTSQKDNYGDPETGCLTDCKLPKLYCGDGVLTKGKEKCDDYWANGTYDSCNATCSGPGPHCGDGTVDMYEQCDEGPLNGQPEHCSSSCVPDDWCLPSGHCSGCSGKHVGTPIPPAIMLLIDRSSEMGLDDRWPIVHDSIVQVLSSVQWVDYAIGMSRFPGDGNACSVPEEVESHPWQLAEGNYFGELLPATYDPDWKEFASPTTEALKVVASLAKAEYQSRPMVVILFSDGRDTCDQDPPPDEDVASIITDMRLQSEAILYVLGIKVDADDDAAVIFLNTAASAGGTGETQFAPISNTDEATVALRKILAENTCTFALDPIDGNGQIYDNQKSLTRLDVGKIEYEMLDDLDACETGDGWMWIGKDEELGNWKYIKLCGAACTNANLGPKSVLAIADCPLMP